MHVNVKAGSLIGRMNSMSSNLLGIGVSLDLTVKFAIICIPRMKKAQALIVQGNPILGISLETKILEKRLVFFINQTEDWD